jgi:hypothetical protein
VASEGARILEGGALVVWQEVNFGGPYQMGYRELSTVPVVGRSFIW